MGLSPPKKFVVFVSMLSCFVFAVLAGGSLQPSPNPLARFKWATWQEREGNVEGGGKRKERIYLSIYLKSRD